MIQIFIYVKGLTVQCYPGPHYSVYLGAAIADQCQARVETVWPIAGQDSEGQAGPVRSEHWGCGTNQRAGARGREWSTGGDQTRPVGTQPGPGRSEETGRKSEQNREY